jgi:diguanylate cyclase (GGDEF)-like protein
MVAGSIQSQNRAVAPDVENTGSPVSLRILLIDNDEDEALRSEQALRERWGTSVVVTRATSLADAIPVLLAADATPAVDGVVLEWNLPDAAGIAALAGVRGAAPDVPVVVYSRAVCDDSAIRALRAGALECADKAGATPALMARLLAFAFERQRRIAVLEAARLDAAHRATHDPLTGLANRPLFLDHLDRALGTRYGRKTGVLFVDLDGFKAVNDRHGHAAGDLLLKAVASRLLESVRRSDAVARIGGDEFVVLLTDVTSRRDLVHVRETILNALAEPVTLDSGVVARVGASIGSAMAPLDGTTAHALLSAADVDMYLDKADGRLAFEGTGAATATARSRESDGPPSLLHRRERRLREAVEHHEFEVFYQPVLDVVTERIVGAEALLRWSDPDRGIVGPAGFLALAEDTGLIVPLGEEVLRSACTAVVVWRSRHDARHLRVGVNLSAVQLREHGFERRVADILAETGCPPEALALELTENSTLVDGDATMETLRALKSLGLRLVVDDFGVGHASLTFLREAPVDAIKIDRRFVAQLLLDQRDQAIVGSMVRLARGLGLDVVAEGVESAAQAQRLARLQCFVQQGRHFGEPVPAPRFVVRLQASAARGAAGRSDLRRPDGGTLHRHVAT